MVYRETPRGLECPVLAAARKLALSSAVLLLLVACEELEVPFDAGLRDGGNDQSDGAVPSTCPTASDFVGDSSWPYSFSVESSAVYCGLVTETPLRSAPSKAQRLRLSPGTYRLPETSGTYAMRLPFCIEDSTSSAFELGGPSPLSLDRLPLGEDAFWLYKLEQGYTLGGMARVLDVGIDVFYTTSLGRPPELILDDARDHGSNPDTSATYLSSCETPCGDPIWFEPCPTPGEGELYAVRFDRGRVELRVRVYPAFGPTGPAALTQAMGTLDGQGFTQSSFFKLAHRPDHHNHGGGFFVAFDAPIGDVCGIELEVPSRDGGWAVLGGRSVDCNLETLEELAGLVFEDN